MIFDCRFTVCSTSTENKNHSRQLEQHREGREAEKHIRKRPYSPNTSVSSQVAKDEGISAKRRRLDESESKHSSLYEHQSPTPTSSQTYKTYSESEGQSRYPGHREKSENRRGRNGRNSRGNNETHASKRRHRHEHKKHHEHSQRYQQHSMVRHTHREHRSGRGQNQNGETKQLRTYTSCRQGTKDNRCSQKQKNYSIYKPEPDSQNMKYRRFCNLEVKVGHRRMVTMMEHPSDQIDPSELIVLDEI